jgi:hypothetical protein
VNPTNPRTAVALGTIAGFGIGGVLVPLCTIAITVAPDRVIATTVALSLSIRLIGGSLGYTIYYNIFAEKLGKVLPENVAKAAVGAGLQVSDATKFVMEFLTTPESITTTPGVTPSIVAAATRGAQDSYAYAISFVCYLLRCDNARTSRDLQDPCSWRTPKLPFSIYM